MDDEVEKIEKHAKEEIELLNAALEKNKAINADQQDKIKILQEASAQNLKKVQKVQKDAEVHKKLLEDAHAVKVKNLALDEKKILRAEREAEKGFYRQQLTAAKLKISQSELDMTSLYCALTVLESKCEFD